MSSLISKINTVRIRIKDKKVNEFPDADLAAIANSVLHRVHDTLVAVESNLVLATGTVSCLAETSEYVLADEGIDTNTLIEDSLWIDDYENPLTAVLRTDLDEESGTPEEYAYLPNGSIKLFPTPDEACTLHVTYVEELTEVTEGTLNSYDIPWQGLWDQAIERALVVECLTILERSIRIAAVSAADAWTIALNKTYKRGHFRRFKKGRLFYV